MNKALHALVYLILAVAAAALYFEYNLYGKKELLKERNRQLEDALVTVAATIEKDDAPKGAAAVEAGKDVSPIEAKDVDEPEKENLLEGYRPQLEAANRETIDWRGEAPRKQLRSFYKVGDDGAPEVNTLDGGFVKEGPGTADELLKILFARAKAQRSTLDTTRDELKKMRARLDGLVQDYNKLPPQLRAEKKTVEEKNADIKAKEDKITEVEGQRDKLKGQVEDLTSENKSLKDERDAKADEVEAVKEEIAKKDKLIDQLKKMLQTRPVGPAVQAGGQEVAATFKHGDKGKLVAVDNQGMFCVVEFTEDALKEILGPELQGALPQLEMFVKPGLDASGAPRSKKEIVGRIRLRQIVPGKLLVRADLLGDWQQEQLKVGDVVFPGEK